MIKEEKKTVEGHLDIPEFSYGELDDLQVSFISMCKRKVAKIILVRFIFRCLVENKL